MRANPQNTTRHVSSYYAAKAVPRALLGSLSADAEADERGWAPLSRNDDAVPEAVGLDAER